MLYNNPAYEAIGYIQYKKGFSSESYSEEKLQEILNHRDGILEKYADSDHKAVDSILGMGFCEDFFVPLNYDGILVETKDVFAAAYKIGYAENSIKSKSEKYVLWTIFTEDIYVPVLSMVCIQKHNIFERILKKEKNEFLPVMEKLCPSLQYPICQVSKLQELLKKEYQVRGHVSKSFMLEQLYDAENGIGLCFPDLMSFEYGGKTRALLEKYGYRLR